MRWRGSMITLLACGVLLTGCSAGPKGGTSPSPTRHAAVPPGFSRTTAGPVTFAHPAGWRPSTPPVGASVVVQQAQQKVVYAQAAVLTKVPQVADPEIVGDDAFAGVQLNARDVNRGPFRPLTVPGATKAVRLDYTFQAPAGDVARGTDVSVVYAGQKAFVLRVSGLRTALPDATVEQVVHSMEIRG